MTFPRYFLLDELDGIMYFHPLFFPSAPLFSPLMFAVNDRFTANMATYYTANYFSKPGVQPISGNNLWFRGFPI